MILIFPSFSAVYNQPQARWTMFSYYALILSESCHYHWAQRLCCFIDVI